MTTPYGLRAEWRGLNGVRLHWRVDNEPLVAPGFDAFLVYSSAAEAGPYVQLGSHVVIVAGQAEYAADHAAGTETTWYTVAYYYAAGPTEGDKVDPVEGSGGGRYVTVKDMRDEGVVVGLATNDKLRRLIRQAEGFVERVTGRWFWPRQMDNLRLDGSGSTVLGIEPEIIQIDQLDMLWEPYGVYRLTNLVDLEGVVVYNRHLTQGLTEPDDREDPKIAIASYTFSELGRWPKASQNIIFHGWFGYTELAMDDPVGETATDSQVPLFRGRTPPLIQDATKRMVVRYLPDIADADAYNETAMAHRLQRMKARDQEIQYSASGGGRGGGIITGDRFIDDTLAQYRRPANASMV